MLLCGSTKTGESFSTWKSVRLAEQVLVEASAVAVNVATGTTSQLIDGRDMVHMPSRGRNVQPFALLMPGVVSTTPYDRRNNNSSVNGIRPTHNAWLIDGGYNIDTGGNWGSPLAPNIETVAEFRAIRGNYSAEFGTGGGSQFNVISKCGTNDLHGSTYYFHRNDKLNARNFFSPTREPFKGNDFGFSVGGPVYIPKVYNGKNKTFFYRAARLHQGAEGAAIQSAVAARWRIAPAIFLRSVRTIYDPLTGQPFPGNMIPELQNRCQRRGVRQDVSRHKFPSIQLAETGRRCRAAQGRYRRKEFPHRSSLQRQSPHHVRATRRSIAYRITRLSQASTSLPARIKHQPATWRSTSTPA